MSMPYGMYNEISRDHLEIFICHGPKLPWPESGSRSGILHKAGNVLGVFAHPAYQR